MKLEFSLPAGKFNNVLKAIWAIGEECVLMISDRGIDIRMIDPSNAAMIVVDMAPVTFDTFDADKGEIAIDIREVLEKTLTFTPDAILKVTWDEFNKRLVTESEGARYGIHTIAPSATRKIPTMPKLDLPLEVEIGSDRLRLMIKRAGVVSDHIMLGYTTEEAFFVSSEGDLDVFQQGTLENPVKIVKTAELVTLYSLEMLEPMVKIAKDIVNIRLGRDQPLIMAFALEDVDITYLLAPRIEKPAGEPDV